MRIGSAAVVVTVAAALFFQTVHLGYDVREPGIGVFRSRYSRGQLESAAKERTARWRGQPPPAVRRVFRARISTSARPSGTCGTATRRWLAGTS